MPRPVASELFLLCGGGRVAGRRHGVVEYVVVVDTVERVGGVQQASFSERHPVSFDIDGRLLLLRVLTDAAGRADYRRRLNDAVRCMRRVHDVRRLSPLSPASSTRHQTVVGRVLVGAVGRRHRRRDALRPRVHRLLLVTHLHQHVPTITTRSHTAHTDSSFNTIGLRNETHNIGLYMWKS